MSSSVTTRRSPVQRVQLSPNRQFVHFVTSRRTWSSPLNCQSLSARDPSCVSPLLTSLNSIRMDSNSRYQPNAQRQLSTSNCCPNFLGKYDESTFMSFSPSSYRSEEADQIVPDTTNGINERQYSHVNSFISLSPNSTWSPIDVSYTFQLKFVIVWWSEISPNREWLNIELSMLCKL